MRNIQQWLEWNHFYEYKTFTNSPVYEPHTYSWEKVSQISSNLEFQSHLFRNFCIVITLLGIRINVNLFSLCITGSRCTVCIFFFCSSLVPTFFYPTFFHFGSRIYGCFKTFWRQVRCGRRIYRRRSILCGSCVRIHGEVNLWNVGKISENYERKPEICKYTIQGVRRLWIWSYTSGG